MERVNRHVGQCPAGQQRATAGFAGLVYMAKQASSPYPASASSYLFSSSRAAAACLAGKPPWRTVSRASSSHILRGAGYGKCLLHDLQRDVGDVETLVQLVGGVLQESIVGVSLRHHQVRGQRDL